MASDLAVEQILALKSEGLADEDIARELGLEVTVVKGVTGSKASEIEVEEMLGIIKGLARDEGTTGFVRLNAAKYIVDEHKGRNDKKSGVVVNLGSLNIAQMNEYLSAARKNAWEGLDAAAPVLEIESAPRIEK